MDHDRTQGGAWAGGERLRERLRGLSAVLWCHYGKVFVSYPPRFSSEAAHLVLGGSP
jgi:hypothetical protein